MTVSRTAIGAFVSEVALERRIILVRWVGIGAALAIGNFLTRQPIDRLSFNLSVLAAALANLLMFFVVSRYQESAIPHASYTIAIFDVSLITLGCLLSGGIRSDLRYLYLAAVVVSALRFDIKVTMAIAAMSALAFVGLTWQTPNLSAISDLAGEVWIFLLFILVLTIGAVLLAALLVAAGHRIAATAARNEELVGQLQNTLEELQRTQERVIQAEKEAAVVELAGATAHELFQPMTVAWGYAELLLKNIPQESSHAGPLQGIVHNLTRMREIVYRIGQITRYETQDYPGGLQIVDIGRSISPEAPSSGDQAEG
jgi:signal transduction histidine kinase